MPTNIFEISPNTFNLFSFMLGMTFAAFLSWYRRTAFMYIVGYFMGLAFYYGALKPNFDVPAQKSKVFSEAPEYSKPLPIPEPKSKYK